MRPRSGELNRRIAVERYTSTQHPGTGEEIKTWAVITGSPTIAASWRRASARETLAASQVNAIVTDVFEVRWNAVTATITALDRLLFDGRYYDISDAVEIGFREGVLITASATVTAQGDA